MALKDVNEWDAKKPVRQILILTLSILYSGIRIFDYYKHISLNKMKYCKFRTQRTIFKLEMYNSKQKKISRKGFEATT